MGAWGPASARLLIVGLAPGLHGANRSGRPFTGDASGHFLFAGLHRAELVSAAVPEAARLRGVRLTNAVKCLPPGNRPLPAEVRACRPYLQAELAALWRPGVRRPRVVLALGAVAFRSVQAAARELLPEVAGPPFAHGVEQPLADRLWLLASYHPSRLNTQTGRLTADAFDAVLKQAVARLARR